MIKNLSILIFILLASGMQVASGQTKKITIPSFNDKYCDFVKQLENGDTSINYTDFRNSFLESRQYGNKGIEFSALKSEVYKAIQEKNYEKVISTTCAMLSIDYTSMFAHIYLQKTYNILGDTVARNKYRAIEFGLIYSILNSGDGLTCETGWHATQIEEEYFILNTIIGGEFQGQALISDKKNMCDKMTLKTEEGTVDYFFEINKIIEMEQKIFEK